MKIIKTITVAAIFALSSISSAFAVDSATEQELKNAVKSGLIQAIITPKGQTKAVIQLNFETGSLNMMETSKQKLQKAVAIIQKYPNNYAINVVSYAENLTGDNHTMLMERQTGIVTYLYAKGLGKAAEFNSDTQKITQKAIAAKRVLNNRIDIIITQVPSTTTRS